MIPCETASVGLLELAILAAIRSPLVPDLKFSVTLHTKITLFISHPLILRDTHRRRVLPGGHPTCDRRESHNSDTRHYRDPALSGITTITSPANRKRRCRGVKRKTLGGLTRTLLPVANHGGRSGKFTKFSCRNGDALQREGNFRAATSPVA